MLTLFPRLTPKYSPPPPPSAEPVVPDPETSATEAVTSAIETQEILASVSQAIEASATESALPEIQVEVAPTENSETESPENIEVLSPEAIGSEETASDAPAPVEESDALSAHVETISGSEVILDAMDQHENPSESQANIAATVEPPDVTTASEEPSAGQGVPGQFAPEQSSIVQAALAVFWAEPFENFVPSAQAALEKVASEQVSEEPGAVSDVPEPMNVNDSGEIVISDAEIAGMLDAAADPALLSPSVEMVVESATEVVEVSDIATIAVSDATPVSEAPISVATGFDVTASPALDATDILAPDNIAAETPTEETTILETSEQPVEAAESATHKSSEVSESRPQVEQPSAGLLDLPRVPEPEVMDDAQEVEAYASAAGQAYLDKLDDTFVAHAVRLVKGPIRGRALDIGTGPGQIVLKLARRLSLWKFVGVDLSPAMVEQAQKNLAATPSATGRVEFIEADGNWLEFPRGTFDLVICNSVLHHFAEPQHLLLELARLAKPRGAILLRDLRRPARFMYPLHVRWHGRHYSGTMRQLYCDSVRAAYTIPELQKLVQESPLRGARIFKFGSTHIGIERPYNWVK